VHIRLYRPVDSDAVMALAPRLAIGVAPWRNTSAVANAVQSWVRESLADHSNDQRPVFVAEEAGHVVGFAAAGTRRHWTGEVDAYIGELVVAADRTTRGIGRALVTAIQSWARDAGHLRITLETGAANQDARAFHAALGYTDEEVVLTRSLEKHDR